MSEKIKYWWSEDRQWFCILANDGVNQATVSLTPDEAAKLFARYGLAQRQSPEPVAWRWRYRRDEELGRWLYNDDHPGRGGEIEIQPLYAALSPGNAGAVEAASRDVILNYVGEPVAWRSRQKGSQWWSAHNTDPTEGIRKYGTGGLDAYEIQPLYAAPLPATQGDGGCHRRTGFEAKGRST